MWLNSSSPETCSGVTGSESTWLCCREKRKHNVGRDKQGIKTNRITSQLSAVSVGLHRNTASTSRVDAAEQQWDEVSGKFKTHLWKVRTTANTAKHQKEVPQKTKQLHNLHHRLPLRTGWANMPQESIQPFYLDCCNSTQAAGTPPSPVFNEFCIPWNWRRHPWKWVKGIHCFLSNIIHTFPSFRSSLPSHSENLLGWKRSLNIIFSAQFGLANL